MKMVGVDILILLVILKECFWFFTIEYDVSCWEPARGVPPVAKVMSLRGPTGKRESGLKGALLDLLMHMPQNQSLPTLLHYAFTYTSDIMGVLSPTTSL